MQIVDDTKNEDYSPGDYLLRTRAAPKQILVGPTDISAFEHY